MAGIRGFAGHGLRTVPVGKLTGQLEPRWGEYLAHAVCDVFGILRRLIHR